MAVSMLPQFSSCFSYSIFYVHVFNFFQYFSLHSIFRRCRCHWQTQAGGADPALLAKAAKNAQDLQAILDKNQAFFHDLSSPQQPAGEQNAATAKNMQDLSAAASDPDQAAEQNSRQIAAHSAARGLICEGAFQFLQRHHQLKHLLFGLLQLRFQFGLRIHQLQQIILAACVIYSAVRQLIFNSG